MTKRNANRRPSPLHRLLQVAAAKLALWRLCGRASCQKARACRGDVGACAARLNDWLDTIWATGAAPPFEDMERAVRTPADLRAYRECREAYDRAAAEARWDPAETAAMREKVRRQVLALKQQVDSEP